MSSYCDNADEHKHTTHTRPTVLLQSYSFLPRARAHAQYCTKTPNDLNATLSLIRDVRLHIEKYPSVADNSGENVRTAQHFLTRLLNSLNGKEEVSLSQATACLLGMPAEVGSVDTRYVFASSAVAFCRAQSTNATTHQHEAYERGDDGNADSFTAADAEFNPEYVAQEHVGPCAQPASAVQPDPADATADVEDSDQDRVDLAAAAGALGDLEESEDLISGGPPGATATAKMYRLPNGTHVPVTQAQSYHKRGLALAQLSLAEYACLVNIVPLADANRNEAVPSTVTFANHHSDANRRTNVDEQDEEPMNVEGDDVEPPQRTCKRHSPP